MYGFIIQKGSKWKILYLKIKRLAKLPGADGTGRLDILHFG